MTRPLVIAVTGGIGSGKSTVCDEFARCGVPVIDADQVAREVVLPGSPGLAEITAEFGPFILASDHTLDRAALRRVVFADPAARLKLEAILHPLIRHATRARIAALDADYCLLAIPLLVEKGHYDQIDRVLVVDCPEDVQINRVMSRDSLTAPEVAAIMRTQATRDARLSRADDVIVNAEGLESITTQVARLHEIYRRLARQHARAS